MKKRAHRSSDGPLPAERLVRLATRLYPREFPGALVQDLNAVFAREYRSRLDRRRMRASVLLVRTIGGVIVEALRQRLSGADDSDMPREPSSDSRRVGPAPGPGDDGGRMRPSPAFPLARYVDDLVQDLRTSLRGFAHSPGFAATAVLTLALGLGATTAIYSLANWVLLRPVPGVEKAEELSTVWVGQWRGTAFYPYPISYPNLEDVSARLTTLSGLGAYRRTSLSVAPGVGQARRVDGESVTASYFEVLDVTPRLGRTFTAAEDDPGGASPVAVISHALWQSMFNRDPGVLGREMRINGNLFTVVGVLEEGFRGTERSGQVEVWVPGPGHALVRHHSDTARYTDRDRGLFYMLVARRNAGASWEQVEAELASLGDWLLEQHPEVNAEFEDIGFHVFRSFGIRPLARDRVTATLMLLMGVGGIVLLIACANVANLLLIKGLGRRGEVAVRKALGASRGRLLRQHLTEGVVLWSLGGVAGVGLAYVLTSLFESARLGGVVIEGVTVDMRVVSFAAALSLTVGLLFAVVPALGTRRVGASGALKEAPSKGTSRHSGGRTTLAVVQLAASLTLLVGTLLLVRTLQNLSAVELGFDPTGVYTASLNPMDMGYSQPEAVEYYQTFERRLRGRPEIAQAAVAYRAPSGCCGSSTRLRPAGAEEEDEFLRPQSNTVYTTGFFALLDIPVLRGRVFTEEELGGPGGEARPVVVLSESLAQRLFGSIDTALGRSIEFQVRGRQGLRYRVVGVVGDVRYSNPTRDLDPVVYEPVGLEGGFIQPQATLFLRSTAPSEATSLVREIAASIDADLPVDTVNSLPAEIEAALAEWTLLAKLMSLLAVLAGALAAVGLYGVVSFAVRARTHELGIRMALGADPWRILRLVLRGTIAMTIAGLLLGSGGAAALARFLETRLFGIEPFDPGVWVLAGVLLVGIAFMATALPARRAVRLDPLETLRNL